MEPAGEFFWWIHAFFLCNISLIFRSIKGSITAVRASFFVVGVIYICTTIWRACRFYLYCLDRHGGACIYISNHIFVVIRWGILYFTPDFFSFMN